MRKYKTWGIICAISILVLFFGLWSKVTHQSYAENVFNAGMILTGVSLAVYGYFKFEKLEKK